MRRLSIFGVMALLAGTALGNTIYVDGVLSDIQATFNFAPLGNNDTELASSFQVVAEEKYDSLGDVKFDSWTVHNDNTQGAIIGGIWCQGRFAGGQVSG